MCRREEEEEEEAGVGVHLFIFLFKSLLGERTLFFNLFKNTGIPVEGANTFYHLFIVVYFDQPMSALHVVCWSK